MRPLTAIQREVLETLVKLYEEKKRMIKSKEVARILGKDEGTVRNIIMWLKSLGLVESRTGPAGGYVPTLKAYEVLGSYSHLGVNVGYGQVVVKKEGGELRYSATGLEIMGLFGAEPIRAVVRIAGDVSPIKEGDNVRIESVPRKKVTIEGVVRRVSRSASEILVEVKKMAVIPDEIVGNVIKRRLITVKHDSPLREVAKILYNHGIRGAPVVDEDGDVIGFITTSDIAMVVAKGEDLDAPVSKYMRRSVFSISEDEPLIEAMRYMDFHGVGRLLVLSQSGKPIGIITRTDILRYLLALQ